MNESIVQCREDAVRRRMQGWWSVPQGLKPSWWSVPQGLKLSTDALSDYSIYPYHRLDLIIGLDLDKLGRITETENIILSG